MGTTESAPNRRIGIRHRVKKTAEGESRPTQVAIIQGDEVRPFDLEDEDAELDFALGRFPTAFRAVTAEDDISGIPPHHVKWYKLKKDERTTGHIRVEGKERYIAVKVPAAYDGLQAGDVVAMTLGGSGDILAYALSRRAGEIGAKVLRIPPFVLKEYREGAKDDDATNLAKLVGTRPELFYETGRRDRALITVVESMRARTDAMKARIACEQRLRQHLIGQVFCEPEGLYPEGGIEKAFEQAKASDNILIALTQEEQARERAVVKALEALDIYRELFVPVTGCGPMIAARLISAILDIRRFKSKAKLKAFCGTHLTRAEEGGEQRFARRRGGQVANWSGDARQALYLLGEQWNRRPDSEWGQKLLAYKRMFRVAHPVEACNKCGVPWEQCVKQNQDILADPPDYLKESVPPGTKVLVGRHSKRYTDGHIHRMGLWRTRTKFVERLWSRWWAFERKRQAAEGDKAAA
ncbi:transposase [Candidatus Uhrbacteria bacterium]|nr:transposase [Candidatus Uhrbacteria bacterium]